MFEVCNFLSVLDMIEEHLQPYTTEIRISQLSKEDEKNLIISLSQVLRRIRLGTPFRGSSSQFQVGSESAESLGRFDLHSADNQRLCKILTDLAVFLTVENQHIQHLTASVLLAIFECTSGDNCGVAIHLLFLCAELSLTNILSHCATKELNDSSFGSSESYVIAVNSRMPQANWSYVAGLIQALLSVWKYLKQETDDQLMQVYLNSLNLFLTRVPFSLLDEKYVGGNGLEKKSGPQCIFLGNRLRPQLVFFGYFSQLLCSVAGLMASLEVQQRSFNSHPAIFSTINLVPKLLSWCLSGHGEEENTCITTYLRHKLLMLMTRLSLLKQLQCSVFNSWLELLRDYFEEFLSEQIDMIGPLQDDCLDSPFASWSSEGKIKALHSLHIRRQAIFLFLRCSLVLINLEEATANQCCAVTKLQLDFDLRCCNHKNGLVQLCQWLRNNLPAFNFSKSGLYWRKCLYFTSSFLKLFMNEDDLLFKVLLQMLQLPYHSPQKLDDKERRNQDVDEDFLFHVTEFFNPISLFHVFLAEIHYDHQVLIDYLISKETGTSCVEYLLRCLRIINASLPAFIDFPIANSSFKRRKITSHDLVEQADMLAISAGEADSSHLLVDYRGDREYGDNPCIMEGRFFEEAKQCLFALKDSVENLHQKKLFPYNPKVLLNRLTELQHLCEQSEQE